MWLPASKEDVRKELDQVRTEFAAHMQTLEQTLLGAIEQLHIPPTDLSDADLQARAEFSNSIQALEQTVRDQLQTIEQHISRETRPSQVPQELLQILKKLEQSQKQLSDLSREASQLVSSSQRLYQHIQEQLVSLSSSVSQLSSTPTKLEQIHQRIEGLAHILDQLSSVGSDGKQKPIHDIINAHMQKAIAEIKALGDVHAAWLEQQTHTIQQLQQTIGVAQGYLDTAKMQVSVGESIQGRLSESSNSSEDVEAS